MERREGVMKYIYDEGEDRIISERELKFPHSTGKAVTTVTEMVEQEFSASKKAQEIFSAVLLESLFSVFDGPDKDVILYLDACLLYNLKGKE
jgi:hypothetical protein